MLGPVLAGALLFVLPLPTLLLLDAASFLMSSCALFAIRTRFNTAGPLEQKSVSQEVAEGLHYVLTNPVLRAMAVMTLILNPVLIVTTTQLVLFATVVYHVGNQQVSLLYAAGSLGGVLFSLLAGPLLKRWPFSKVALIALFLLGTLLVVLGFTPWYPLAVVVWGLSQGAEMLFNLNTRSLCQAVVPDHLLGRVMSVLLVLAYATVPIGALFGGILLQGIGTSQVAHVYVVIGLVACLGALGFSFTALGHAGRYLPQPAAVTLPARSRPWRPALRALTAGMGATVPLAIGVIPLMVIYGITALQAGLSPVMVQAMALLVFSGAILPAAQALHAGMPVIVVGLMMVLLNVRHLFYSARLAPKLRRLRLPQRLVASYLLTDESFGMDARRADERKHQQHWWWFLVGAGLTMWLAVQGSTALGLVLGPQVPIWDGMSFIPTLVFVCLAVLSLNGPVSVVVALAAGIAAILLASVPLGLGLLVAVSIGVVTGLISARIAGQRKSAWAKEV